MQEEGYRYMHQRMNSVIDSQTEGSQALNELRQIPQQLFEFGHNMDRMYYGTQQFQFSQPEYHPEPPPAQPYPTQPSSSLGGYYTPQPPTPHPDLLQPSSSFGGYHTPQQPPPPNQDDSFINSIFGFSPSTIEYSNPMNISPVQMGSLSEYANSQNRPESSNRATELARGEDEAEPSQRRRRRVRRGCGTAGHY